MVVPQMRQLRLQRTDLVQIRLVLVVFSHHFVTQLVLSDFALLTVISDIKMKYILNKARSENAKTLRLQAITSLRVY